MAQKGEKEHHDHTLHERRIRYLKRTVSLLTISLQIVLLVFIVIVIFLFVAAGDANKFKEQSTLLINQKSKLESQVGELQSNQIAIVKELPLVQVKDNELIASFALQNRDPVSWTFPFSVARQQIEQGYLQRSVVENTIVPLHSKYAQSCFDFASFCTQDQSQLNELRTYFSSELIDIRQTGTSYVQVPLGDEKRSVMDFRPYVTSEGFDGVQGLYDNRESDKAFLETLWYIVAQLTTYSEEIEETPLYPLETILAGGGDCEDTSILFASMLQAAQTNWDVSFLYMDLRSPTNPYEYNHVIIHVNTGEEEYFVETTNKRQMSTYDKVVGYKLLM